MPPEFMGTNVCPRCRGYGTDGAFPCQCCKGTGELDPPCTCDADTILDGMATPGCPQHAPLALGDTREPAS